MQFNFANLLTDPIYYCQTERDQTELVDGEKIIDINNKDDNQKS